MNQPQANQVTPEAVRSKLKLPPAMQGPYQRIVLAGQKILYSEQAADQIKQLLQSDEPIGKKIGDGTTALLAILIDQSNHTMPPQLVIPAGVELCASFAALLRDSGQQVTDQDTSVGIETMVATVMQKLDKGGAQQPQPQAPQAPAAPDEQPAAPEAPAADETEE